MERFELVVIGGGSGGVGAALAAARAGVSTLVVEKQAGLGGTATAGGVNTWEMGVGGTGLPFEIYQRLKAVPQAVGIYSCGRHFGWQERFYWPRELDKVNVPGGENRIDPARCYRDTLRRHPGPDGTKSEAWCREHWHGVTFEPAAMDQTLQAMLAETGCCAVRLGVGLEAVDAAAGRVASVHLSDGTTVAGEAWVDGTGDGLLCRLAGCEQLCGVEGKERFGEPGAPQVPRETVNACTLVFRVEAGHPPAVEPLPPGVPDAPWWRETPVPTCINEYPNGDRNLNMLPTMEGAEALRLGSEAAYAECWRRTQCHWHFVQTHFPEFRAYRRVWTAPLLGWRETSRTVCEKMLTEKDILLGLSGQADPDLIAVADHALDRHGEGGGCPEVDEPYGIPYRCLIPQGFRNLLIACRGAGFSSIAASSCRLSRTMMQLGQAAGNAVALAREGRCDLPDIDAAALRARLAAQHVQLSWPLPPELRAYLGDA